MATAGSIVIDLLMKTGAFETDTKRAEKRLADLGKEAKRVGTIIGAALAGAATTAATAIKQSIDRMDELSKASQRAQMPTEEFSRLAYAGELADVAMGDIVTSMGRLARAQGDAARGLKTQQEAFKTLGIEYKNVDGTLRSSTEVFLDFADAYERFKGSPEVLAVGMQVFGRSFQNLIPLLKDGRAGLMAAAEEADKLGYTLSEQAGKQAEEFNDNLTRLKQVVLGLSNQVAADLLPDLVDLSGGFVDSAKEGDRMANAVDGITDAIRDLIEIGRSAGQFFQFLESIRTGLNGLQDQAVGTFKALQAALTLDGAGLDAAMATYAQGTAQLEAAAAGRTYTSPEKIKQNLQQQLKDSMAPLPASYYADAAPSRDQWYFGENAPKITPTGSGSKSGGGGKSDAEREAEALERAYQSLNDQLAESIALHGQTGEAARVRYEIEHGALSALDEAKAAQLIKEAEHLDLLDEIAEHEEIAADAAREYAEEQQRRLEQFQEVLSTIRDEIDLVQMSSAAQEVWNNLKWAGVDAESEWGRAIIDATEELQRQRDAMDNQIEAMDGLRDAAKGFFSDLRDGVGVWDALEKAADRFLDVLFEIVLQQTIANALGKQGDPGGGSWGDAVGGLLGSWFGGGRASGGDVMPRTAYLVGEQGPEMFVPRTAGTVIPAAATASMREGRSSRGGDQTVIFNVAGGIDRRSAEQIALAERRKQLESAARFG